MVNVERDQWYGFWEMSKNKYKGELCREDEHYSGKRRKAKEGKDKHWSKERKINCAERSDKPLTHSPRLPQTAGYIHGEDEPHITQECCSQYSGSSESEQHYYTIIECV